MEHEVIRMTFNLYGHLFDDRGDSWLPLWTAGITPRVIAVRTNQQRISAGDEAAALDAKRAEKSPLTCGCSLWT